MTLCVKLHHQFPSFDLDVRFDAPSGITGLFARSGAGKTSVIRAVAGLLRPDNGRIVLGDRVLFGDGVNVPPHLRRIGYVFQEPRLFPHLTVRQNLTYGGRVNFDQVVDMLGIGALLNRRPAGLSGGEAQRVALGRALMSGAEMLLLDEPLAALDAPRKAEILPYLETLRDHALIPMLYVSHSVDEVARLASTIVVMDAGRVIRSGPARDVLSDISATTIFGKREAGAILSGTITAHESDGLTRVETLLGPIFIPHQGKIGARILIRIHAQDVMLSRTRPKDISALNILPVTVIDIQPEGDGNVMVQLGAEKLLARITARSCAALRLTAGSDCFAILKSVAVAQTDIAREV
jgi:molybdate transport system ATP-binding protein